MQNATQTPMPMPAATRSASAVWMSRPIALPTMSPASTATNSDAPSGCHSDRPIALVRAASKRASALTSRVSPTGPYCPRRGVGRHAPGSIELGYPANQSLPHRRRVAEVAGAACPPCTAAGPLGPVPAADEQDHRRHDNEDDGGFREAPP